MNGPPQNPITAFSAGELRPDEPDRLEHRRERLLDVRHAEPLDVGGAPDRPVDHRADALHELDVEPHPENRGHDVREHDGRVDAVPPHRLERHLGAELGLVRDLEERVALADRAVLRQRPPRLAHEPDGRALDGLAPRGADEKRIGHHGERSPRRARTRLVRRGSPRTVLGEWTLAAAARGRAHDGAARAREHGLGDLAVARRGRAAARVPLARHAWERDRVGRPADAVPAADRAGRDDRARRAGRPLRDRPAGTSSASTSSRSTASGCPRSGCRRSTSSSTSSR